MHLPFEPLNDRVIVKRIDEVVDGTLVVSKKYRQASNKCEVVAAAKGIDLKPGDYVLVGEYNAEAFNKDGVELFIVRLGDIRGVEREVTNE
jgi:co-chaperonin GroES (HSP10)